MEKPEEIQPNGYYVDLRSRRMTVRRGWGTAVADQIVERSLEPDIVSRYARDSRSRFTDLAGANRWFKNNQPMYFYTLELARATELLGVAWIAPPEDKIPTVERAFSLRMYESSRSGSAVDFGRVALLDYDNANPDYEGDIGLRVDRDHTDSIKIYEALDFAQIGKLRPTEQFATMVRPGYRTRTSSSSSGVSRRRT